MAKKYVDSFVIDRKWWMVPNNYKDVKTIFTGKLLNEEGMMCCLGVYAKHCKIRKRELQYIGKPDELDIGTKSKYIQRLCDIDEENFPTDKQETEKLIEANDSIDLSPKERESKIKNLFNKLGIKVNFKGDYRKDKLYM